MSEFADEPIQGEDPGLGAAATAEPTEAPAASSFDPAVFESPEFRDAVAYASRQELAAVLEQAAQYEPQAEGAEGEQSELDPYGDPAGFQTYLAKLVDQGVERRVSALEPTVHAFEDQQNQQKIEGWVEQIPSVQESQQMLGEDVAPNSASNAVQYMATGYLPELEDRYGPGERATQTALRMAADQYKAQIKAAHDAGYAARNAELQGLSGVRAPVSVGAVEGVVLGDQPADEMEAAELWSNRNGYS